MKTRTVAALAAVLTILSSSALAQPSDAPRDSKRSTVETFRNNRVTPARNGRSLVASFGRSTSSIGGGLGTSLVKSSKRKDGPNNWNGRSSVVTVRSRGGSAPDTSVASVSGEAQRGPNRK